MNGNLLAKGKSLTLFAGAVGVVVVGYNVWSYCCGHCTIQTFCTLGPAGYVLLGLIAVAALSLIVLKYRKSTFASQHRCHCGTQLENQWKFCPDCGDNRSL